MIPLAEACDRINAYWQARGGVDRETTDEDAAWSIYWEFLSVEAHYDQMRDSLPRNQID